MSTNDANEPTRELPNAAETGAVTYMYRPALMGSPQEFAVERDALAWNIGRHAGRIPYGSIRRVRLTYRPTSMQMHRFLMEIWSDAAPKLTIASSSWRSLVDQQRQDGPYKDFVRALHRRFLETRARPALNAGSSPFVYWPGVVVFAGMAVTLSVMLLRGSAEKSVGPAVVVALVVGFFLWHLAIFFWRNRPVAYSAEAVPEAVLPRG